VKTSKKTYLDLLANPRTEIRRMIVVVTSRLLHLKKPQSQMKIAVTM
jgi:hypothetical protein